MSTNLGPISDALQAQLNGQPAPKPTTTPAPAPQPTAKSAPPPPPAPAANKGQAALAQPAAKTTTTAKAAAPAKTPASQPAVQASSNGTPTPAQIAATAPPLGFHSGVNPTGTGDCDGAIPGGPKIPCSCPPSQADFLAALDANVAAGHAVHNPVVPVKWPLDNSKASQAIRIESSLTTLQNLKGPGVGESILISPRAISVILMSSM